MSFDVNQDPDRPGPAPPADPPFRPGPRRHADALIARVRPWAHWVGGGRIVTAAVTVLAVGAGGWWLLRAPPPPTEAGLPYAGHVDNDPAGDDGGDRQTGSTEATVVSVPVVVHVAGAVVEPGVYELPSGSRVHAAIDAAGGPLPRAEPSALNLAAPLADGERIYVPTGRRARARSAAVDVATSGTVAQPSGTDRRQPRHRRATRRVAGHRPDHRGGHRRSSPAERPVRQRRRPGGRQRHRTGQARGDP